MWGLFVVPLLLFFSQVIIQGSGTLRIIYLSKGKKALGALLGFVEVLVWILAVSQIMENYNSPLYYVVYALGFSAGTYLGGILEEKIALGVLLIKVITKKKASALIKILREKNIRLTNVEAIGENGPVNVLYIIIKRKSSQPIVNLIKKYHAKSFFTVEDVRHVNEGDFPLGAIDHHRKSFLRR